MSTYAELLQDPRWQRKRLEILERDEWTCQECGEKTKTLHVDHRVYQFGVQPWDYPGDTLWTLCADCHSKITDTRKRLKAAIGTLDLHQLELAIGFVEASRDLRIGDDSRRIKINIGAVNLPIAQGIAMAIGVSTAVVSDDMDGNDSVSAYVIWQKKITEQMNAWRNAGRPDNFCHRCLLAPSAKPVGET